MATQFEGVIVIGDFLTERNSSDEVKFTSSCSGILLNPKHGLILTTGVLLTPQLAKKQGIVNNISSRIYRFIGYHDNDEEIQNLTKKIRAKFYILLEKNSVDGNRKYYKHKAKLIGGCFSESLENELKNLMKDNSWKPLAQTVEFKQLKLKMAFVLLQIQDNTYPVPQEIDVRNKQLPSFVSNVLIDCWDFIATVKQGEKILCESSLFGELSPAVFMNSVSEGIIVNKCGSLFLTDARCAPGSEGGIVFVKRRNEDHQRLWVGMIMASLSWKQKDLLGLSVGCCANSIVLDLMRQFKYPIRRSISTDVHDTVWTDALRSIVVIKNGSGWGSGIIINKLQKIILTCSHVVRNAVSVIVEVHYPEIRVFEAQVLYLSPEGDVPDIAVLKIAVDVKLHQEITYKETVLKIGDDVLAAGFAIFSPSCHTGVNITSGVISKIVYINKIPIMMQTSCSVFGGASGGLILSVFSGNALGLIVCNAKDNKKNVTYPTVNLAIPFASFYPVIDEFLISGDKSVLEQLQNDNNNVTTLWKLGKLPYGPQSNL